MRDLPKPAPPSRDDARCEFDRCLPSFDPSSVLALRLDIVIDRVKLGLLINGATAQHQKARSGRAAVAAWRATVRPADRIDICKFEVFVVPYPAGRRYPL